MQAGGRRFDPDILHHTSRRRVADLSASADGTVAPRHRPKRLSRNRRAISVCHASGSCSLTIHGKRIEIVDGKSAGVKAFRHRAVNDIMIASTDIFIFEVCEYDEFDRQTRKYSNTDYPVSDFSP